MADNDASRLGSMVGQGKSPNVGRRKLRAVDNCLLVLVGDGQAVTGIRSGVSQIDEGGKTEKVAG